MSRRSVRTVAMVAALSPWLGTSAWAQESSLSLNLGYFAVRGEDTRIADDVVATNLGLFAFGLDQFNNASVGGRLAHRVRRLSGGRARGRVLPADRPERVRRLRQPGRYRDSPGLQAARHAGHGDRPVSSPFGLRSAIQPYAGAGVGFFNWRYSEVGEFVDFNTFDVFRDRFVAEGNDVGGVYLAGLRVLAGSRFAVGAEIRYQDVQGVVGLDQGFLDERIDLGGLTTSFTFNVRF